MYKKWPMNVGEEPDARNATLDSGTGSRQILNLIFICFLSFKLLKKNCQHVKFKLIPRQGFFKLFPVSRIVNLASVELSGELMISNI